MIIKATEKPVEANSLVCEHGRRVGKCGDCEVQELNGEISDLQAENKRLREALERRVEYAYIEGFSDGRSDAELEQGNNAADEFKRSRAFESLNNLLKHNEVKPVKESELVENILYWGNEEINKMSEVIDCEEGSARFASCGGINGVFSRMRRAFKDEDYRKHLVKPPVTEVSQ